MDCNLSSGDECTQDSYKVKREGDTAETVQEHVPSISCSLSLSKGGVVVRQLPPTCDLSEGEMETAVQHRQEDNPPLSRIPSEGGGVMVKWENQTDGPVSGLGRG